MCMRSENGVYVSQLYFFFKTAKVDADYRRLNACMPSYTSCMCDEWMDGFDLEQGRWKVYVRGNELNVHRKSGYIVSY